MNDTAFQDYYADQYSHCYGCGKHNADGYGLKSHWDGDTTVAYFTPRPYHSGGFPGNVYGGLIASLMDCHGAGSAFAAAYRAEGREMGNGPPMRFVTASLTVNYLRPTPLGKELEIRGEIREIKGRKVTVDLSVAAGGTVCATGSMIAVRLPETSPEQDE
ncbi:MAG: PaaI family thioesterase [Thermodesulfobacteriota bacterium]